MEGIVQGGVALVVFVGIGYVLLAKMTQTNPKFGEGLRKLLPGKVMEKIETPKESDRIEQVYDERRAMM